MKPIWYFVGLILLTMGIVLAAAGIYDLISHTESKSILGELYPSIWWGALMIIVGLVYIFKNKNVKIE